ncbi:hypothetical protein BCS37_00180 [Selenomonas sp. oral taxon 920]|uniref:DUF554 domain-containing protein n=1 Tax=Selenomonas sp. oral taxon 920 TaxID=1884263 RepID=UPI000840A0B1|nr:DUF554 domain-containing protein [Selenomonas sp. oral taxon 920]AOH46962.1 hypothetical protein BCS37_00180 [Selenomonas sp. oral taxon 920]
MPGIGVIVNVIAVVLGGLLGLGCGRFLAERFQETIMRACALVVIFLGLGGALSKMLAVDTDGRLSFIGIDMMLAALIGGAIIGEILNIEDRMTAFGAWLKRVSGSTGDTHFIDGFVSASLTICVGAMSVIGAVNDRLLADPSVLFAKSVLDGIVIMLLTATLGRGCIFSAISVGIFEGAIFLAAGVVEPFMTPAALANLSYVGSILIFCVGTNLFTLPYIRVANFLPALVIAVLWPFL